MYKVALIGVSGWGDIHYQDQKSLHEAGKVAIVGATIINQDEEAEKCAWLCSVGCEIFNDYRQMLNKLSGKLDLCCIPTGTSMHCDMTCAALRAGANVFLEKPVSATIQEARKMAQLESECGKFVAIGYQHMYQPGIHELKRFLLSEELGKIKVIKMQYLVLRQKAYYERNHWAGKVRLDNGDWVLDSPFNNACAHPLNAMLFLAGKSFEKSAILSSVKAELYRAKPQIDNADTVCMKALTDDGVQVIYINSHAYDGIKMESSIECENGVIDGFYGGIVKIKYNDGRETEIDTGNMTAREVILDTLLKKLADPQVFACDLDVAATQTLCVDGIHESSAVNPIAAEYTTFAEPADARFSGEMTYINDLEAISCAAYAQNKLFSELGDVPWAVPGADFDLKDYKYFNGGKTGF